MIGLQLRLWIPENKRREFLQIAESLTAREREPECVLRSVFQEMSNSGQFLWLERWTTRRDLRQHLQSAAHRTLVGAIEVLGTLEECRFSEPIDEAVLAEVE